MLYIIVLVIALIPLFAIAKVVARKTGINGWIVFWYGIFWLIALFSLVANHMEDAIKIFLFPIVVHLILRVIVSIWRWSVEELSKD